MTKKDCYHAVVYQDQGKWKIYHIYEDFDYINKVFPTLQSVKLRQFEGVRIEPINRHTNQFIDGYMRDKFGDQQ